MKSISLIHTSWLKPFASYFSKRKRPLHRYYEQASIESELVESGEGWITKHQLYKFLNTLARGEKIPELGFVVGDTITPDHLGAIGEALAEAKTLGEAIRAFCRLINRHSEENRAWLEEGDEGQIWLFDQTTNPFPADRRIADHAGLMSLTNLVRLVGGKVWYPAKVALQTKTTTAWKQIPGLQDTKIQFDQSATGLAFPAEWLLRPIHLDQVNPKRPSANDDLLDEYESLVKKLKRLIREILGVGGLAPSVHLMAELCNTSVRTLHRRLAEKGVSYQDLLDQVRLHLARTQLKRSGITIKELAAEVGYSGPNNFIRAFKRMEGVTPTEFRRRSK